MARHTLRPMNTVNNGLEGVVAAETNLSMVDGARGELVIAGFPVAELALNATFEETVWLLWHGALPHAGELQVFRADLASRRALAPIALEVLRNAAESRIDPMDALRIGGGLTILSGDDFDDARNLVAVFPTIVAAYRR